jgi:hypothetical protein
MRQIGIALHTAQDAYGWMPGWGQPYFFPGQMQFANIPAGNLTTFRGSVHFWLLPFIDQQNLMLNWDVSGFTQSGNGPVGQDPGTNPPKLYLCPSDPSGINFQTGMGNSQAITSYLCNGQVFFQIPSPKIPGSFPDGVSTTTLFYEGYGLCNGTNLNAADMLAIGTSSTWSWNKDPRESRVWRIDGPDQWHNVIYWDNNSIFAADQTNPVVYDRTGTTNPYLKFQQQPAVDHCYEATTQAPHTSGMNVLMGDASVKLVNARVSPGTWHSAITPNKRDITGNDW